MSDQIETFKKLIIISLFADDDLVDRLVLKGGNAMAYGYGMKDRVSADIDLSMADPFEDDELDDIRQTIEKQMNQNFRPIGYLVFDVNIVKKPKPSKKYGDQLPDWFGYKVDMKIISLEQAEALGNNINEMRKQAIAPSGPSQRRRFEVDISPNEYCHDKDEVELDDYTIYVYTPALFVCEKIRAICQQLPEYDVIVHRDRSGRGNPRPRDFFDIHAVVEKFGISLSDPRNQELIQHVFKAKKVPLDFIGKVHTSHDLHQSQWQSVIDTVDQTKVELKSFEYYFDYVMKLIEPLHPLGDM